MNRLYYLLVILFLFFGIIESKADRALPSFLPLSEQASISLLTCDPGDQLYTTFGHSAIRIKDPYQNLDLVFNYGTFNFQVPHFYLKFASGKLLYKISFESYKRFMYMYIREDRSVFEQTLNLSIEQNQQLFDRIKINYLPENRYYKYDFFFDNCATRIIDIFSDVLGDSLIYNSSLPAEHITFRQLLNQYLKNSDWSNFGINLLLGSVTDVDATALEKAFLPDYLKIYCDHLYVNGKPLVKTSQFVLDGDSKVPQTKFYSSPMLWFWMLFSVVLILTYLFRKKSWVIADKTMFFFIGFFGLMVLLATTATDHEAMRLNLNLLWIHPIYMVLAGFIGSKRKRITFLLALTFLIVNLLVIIGWYWIPQMFHPFFIPIILLLSVRLFVISVSLK